MTSKFLDKLNVAIGKRVPIDEPLLAVSLQESTLPAFSTHQTAREFHLKITLGSTVLLDEDLIQTSGGKVVEVAIEDMKASIARLVYGDIKEPLLDLRDTLTRRAYGRECAEIKTIDSILRMIQP